MDDPLDDTEENALVKLASLLVIGVGLVALFLGQSWFWMVFAVGFAVFVPAVKLLTDELGVAGVPDGSTEGSSSESRSDRLGADAPDSKQDALDALRERYARGELDEAEFERKVEHLLETETLEGAREHVERRVQSGERADGSRDDEYADGTGDEHAGESGDRDRVTEH